MAEEEKVEKAPVKKTAAKKTTSSKAAASETKVAKKTTIRKTTKKAAETAEAPAEKKTTAKKATKKAAETAEAPVEKKTTAKKATKKAAPKAKGECKKAAVVSRVEVDYKERVVAELVKEFGYKSIMEVPHLEKIVINMGVGEAASNSKAIEEAMADLTLIAGQRPVVTKSKKSVANFKLRQGQAIGCKVTLRGVRMYDFFDKLITIALPRVRDFRGVSKNSFDGRGNYALGVKEQLIFPEIDYDKIAHLRGMDIIVVTSAKSDKEAYALLEKMGMPFKR